LDFAPASLEQLNLSEPKILILMIAYAHILFSTLVSFSIHMQPHSRKDQIEVTFSAGDD
jgi:hypothetical protein